MLAEVTWRSSVKAATLSELDAILDSIAKEVSPDLPQAVHVTRENGDCLSIVLGAKTGSVLNFVAASGDPPYFSSLGNPSAKGIFTFYVAEDHHSEMPAWHVVSECETREAVREFVSRPTGLPRNIAWTMD
jgi:hypothetical protein